MEKKATPLDPLAALEAEYAAVLAQDRQSPGESQLPGDAESAGSDSEDEESAAVGGFESYALLPSSPCNSDSDVLEASPDVEDADRSEEDAVERPQSEMKTEDAVERPQSETKTEEASTQHNAELQEDKRQVIMQSMQQVKLRPPPWAEAANLTDDELVDMVQKQLGLKNK
ncbi:hypothetical protein PHMEG_00039413 [Phytophthora megakarya]|uniref:Uncharacterized protein n=1 Tax=Phytophthora megakarya TaxID=4795 RepID=A0A225UFL2_9STRA|nr:hypothetical protein PHMEG_00039413 [Phytophthora megakarya]